MALNTGVFWPISTRVRRPLVAQHAAKLAERAHDVVAGEQFQQVAAENGVEGLVAKGHVAGVHGLAVRLGPAGTCARAVRCVRAAMLGDRSTPMVAPLALARTSRRNISPVPVATSSTCMPSRIPEASSAQRCAREWNSMVETG